MKNSKKKWPFVMVATVIVVVLFLSCNKPKGNVATNSTLKVDSTLVYDTPQKLDIKLRLHIPEYIRSRFPVISVHCLFKND